MKDRDSDKKTEIGEDLKITKIERRETNGTWVWGRLNGYRFNALVFAGHAYMPEWEFKNSRISKLWIQSLETEKTVFNWDRGADVPVADATVQAIVEFLCEGLADLCE